MADSIKASKQEIVDYANSLRAQNEYNEKLIRDLQNSLKASQEYNDILSKENARLKSVQEKLYNILDQV